MSFVIPVVTHSIHSCSTHPGTYIIDHLHCVRCLTDHFDNISNVRKCNKLVRFCEFIASWEWWTFSMTATAAAVIDSAVTVLDFSRKCLWRSVMSIICLTPYLLRYLYKLNFHPRETVSRYREPQLQVGENYPYVFNLGPNIGRFCCLNTHFIPNNCDLPC